MPKPIPIQIAIQGGGAKLPAILAVLQALEKMVEARKLEVTRIAATSAGSIAGCLFAAPIKMEVARTHLKGRADAFIAAYALPGSWRKFTQAFTGDPFWDVTPLKTSLIELFGKRTKLGDLGKPVAIVSTDLKNLKKVVRSNKSDPLVDSILDSCAIPLFFRTFAQDKDGSALIVDGGICANLPAEELAAGPDGEIVGISFATTVMPSNPTGVVGFTQALLNTAMDHAVLRAREQLGKNLLPIETDIDTFDFARAMTEGLEKEWDNCYRQGEAFFEDFVARATAADEQRAGEDAVAAQRAAEEAASAQRQAHRTQELTTTLNDVRAKVLHAYLRQEAPKPFAYEKVSMLAVGHSLADPQQTDLLIRKVRFHAAKEPIYAYRGSSTTSATEQPVSDDFRFYDRDGNELDLQTIELAPQQKVINGAQSIVYPKIVYFDTPLMPGDPRGPFELVTFERYTGVLGKLRTEDDWLSIVITRTITPVPIVDIVAHLPKNYSGTILSGGGIRDESGAWADFHPGMALTPQILNKEYAPPDGFFALGWRGFDVPIGKRFGCNINRPKGAGK